MWENFFSSLNKIRWKSGCHIWLLKWRWGHHLNKILFVFFFFWEEINLPRGLDDPAPRVQRWLNSQNLTMHFGSFHKLLLQVITGHHGRRFLFFKVCRCQRFFVWNDMKGSGISVHFRKNPRFVNCEIRFIYLYLPNASFYLFIQWLSIFNLFTYLFHAF